MVFSFILERGHHKVTAVTAKKSPTSPSFIWALLSGCHMGGEGVYEHDLASQEPNFLLLFDEALGGHAV